MGFILGFIRKILGLYRDNGQENGNYFGILGIYRDNGKQELAPS